jgi:hypothetical protein
MCSRLGPAVRSASELLVAMFHVERRRLRRGAGVGARGREMPGRKFGRWAEPTERRVPAGARALVPSSQASVVRPARKSPNAMFHVERRRRRRPVGLGVPEAGMARRELSRWGEPTTASDQAAARNRGRLGQPVAAGGSTWNTWPSDDAAAARTGAAICREDLGARQWFDGASGPAAETSAR